MPIVFVHGVNNRIEDPSYKVGTLVISQFLQRHFAGALTNGKHLRSVQARFPYWGGLATTFAWNMAALPTGEIDALGANIPDELRPLVIVIGEEIGSQPQTRKDPLLALARKSLPKAVAALSEVVICNATDANAASIAAFVANAQAYAEANPAPVWLSGLTTDEHFVVALAQQVVPRTATEVDVLGVSDVILVPLSIAAARIKSAVSSVAETVLNQTGDFASTHILAYARRPLNALMGRFFGDVFAYLDSRGDKTVPGAIPKLILDEIDAAVMNEPAGEPLVLIGHSLGGVILFDLLSHFRPDLQVDLFITVGSQVSHFEEMKRFKNSDRSVPSPTQPRARRPPNIARWINAFDEVDIFAYVCGRVFEDVEDFSYDTGTYIVKAHGAYLEQDRFFARLRKRIDGSPT